MVAILHRNSEIICLYCKKPTGKGYSWPETQEGKVPKTIVINFIPCKTCLEQLGGKGLYIVDTVIRDSKPFPTGSWAFATEDMIAKMTFREEILKQGFCLMEHGEFLEMQAKAGKGNNGQEVKIR